MDINEMQQMIKYQLVSRHLILKAQLKAWVIYNTTMDMYKQITLIEAEIKEIERQLTIIKNKGILSTTFTD